MSKGNDEKVNEIRELLEEDNTMCIRVLARRTGLSLRTVHKVLRECLQLCKCPAKWIPHALNDNQKQRRVRMSRDILARFRCSPTLKDRVITGDQSWFWCYEPAMKRSMLAWLHSNEAHPEKPVKDRYVRKVMIIIFWNSLGVVLRQFMEAGHGVNAQVYLETMHTLREQIRCCHRDLWNRQSFWIHHDGAPAHRSAVVQQFLQNTNTKILPHPPYSNDLAPLDFFLFARIKCNMHRETFNSIAELKRRIDFEIGQIPQWEYAHAMRESWPKRLQQCVQVGGRYFET